MPIYDGEDGILPARMLESQRCGVSSSSIQRQQIRMNAKMKMLQMQVMVKEFKCGNNLILVSTW